MSAAVALVAGLVGVLVLVAVLILVGILIGVLVLVGILVLVIVVHEDTSFSGCPFAGAVMMPAKRRDMRENYQKKMQKIVDRAKTLWYNTPENKKGRCIRPHLQQWQRG
jgi:hypothetical protein